MAPKRKASTEVASEQVPPTKRVTRSRGPLVETQPPLARSNRRTRDSTVKLAQGTSEADTDVEKHGAKNMTRKARGRPRKLAEEQVDDSSAGDEDSSPRPKTRPRALAKSNERALSVEASSSAVPVVSSQDNSADDSPDELLLQSPNQGPVRYSTPMKALKLRPDGTPRIVLDAVEIVTPSRRLRATLSSAHPSPRPLQTRGGTSIVPTSVAERQFPTIPASPSKRVSPRRRVPLGLRPEATDAEKSLHETIPQSPTKQAVQTPQSSRRKGQAIPLQASPSRLPRVLPPHLHSSLTTQKRTVLRALNSLRVFEPEDDGSDDYEQSPNAIVYQHLSDMLKGTVDRGEGNSCFVVGPRGSGKTQVVERALAALPEPPIIIRLAAHVQVNDTLAVREIAWQLADQVGKSLLPPNDAEEDNQDAAEDTPVNGSETLISLPPSAHLLALISMIPTLPRPTVIILDGIELFATHARQALLYCLFDTAQSCRVGEGRKGLAVIGVTSHIDVVIALEKRVKSRFSGRVWRTACPRTLSDWMRTAKKALCTPIQQDHGGEWARMWEISVEAFLEDRRVQEGLRETFSLGRDVRLLSRILITPVASLKPSSPFLDASVLQESVTIQRCPPRLAFSSSLTYPSVCLLIAAVHAQTSGHDTYTFEMLYESFRDQVRTSLSAPVQVGGGSIGMVRCSREVMFTTFERLTDQRLFVAAVAPTSVSGREFVRYWCSIDRSDVKKIVEKTGQLNLKKWLSKLQ